MITEHSKFPPSGMDILVPCPGSWRMSEGVIDLETEDSRIGTAAHFVPEKLLVNDIVSVGEPAPNGVILTEEMFEYAADYIDDVRLVAGNHPVNVESRVDMPEIHPDCWGTPDCWYFDLSNLTLYVWDYKYGHGRVRAYANYQLAAYALGILNLLSKGSPLGLAMKDVKLVLTIHQPRCYDGSGPVDRWLLSAIDLRSYINQMHMACALAESPNTQCHTGPHCKNCIGRFQCSALQNSGISIVSWLGDSMPRVMSASTLAYELSILEQAEVLLKCRKEALEENALSRISSGEIIPGYIEKQGYSRDKWNKSNEEVVILGDLMGIDLRDPKVKSPSQACELLKKTGADPELIKSYFSKTLTGKKLVKADPSQAQRMFNSGE